MVYFWCVALDYLGLVSYAVGMAKAHTLFTSSSVAYGFARRTLDAYRFEISQMVLTRFKPDVGRRARTMSGPESSGSKLPD
jgi:hypothetical protein